MAVVPRPSDDFLTSKAGPLPVWSWGLIGLVLAYGYYYYKSKKAASSAASTTSATDTAASGIDSTGSASVPDYVFDSYTTVNNNETENPLATPPVNTGPIGPTQSPLPPPNNYRPPSPITPPVTKPPVVPPARKPPVGTPKPRVIEYRVKKGDTLTSIAKKYHTTVDAIWKYNTTAGNRPAATIKTLEKRGKNLIFSNELIDIAVPS